MGRNKILLLFDVDGTLTRPMQVITADMKTFLMKKVRPLATLGLVGGSNYEKIHEQMGEGFEKDFYYVFCENGLLRYVNGQLTGSESMLDRIGEPLSQKFINFCLKYLSELSLPAKRGNFVEFRTGMLNISPIGRSCSMAEREEFVKYDVQHGIRKKFVEAMKAAFPDSGLQFSLGGQISVDVFPIGWNKTYCLQHIENSFAEIHFFGDKTDAGGNDHEIYEHQMTIGHKVLSPDDTKQQLIELFNIDA